MKAALAILPLLLLLGCHGEPEDQVVPAPADVLRLEASLAKHPCVGSLDQWERTYRFSRTTGLFSPYSLNPDLDVIEFHLRKVGTVAIPPGRNVIAPGGDWPDSKPIESLDGTFTLGSDALRLERCEKAVLRSS